MPQKPRPTSPHYLFEKSLDLLSARERRAFGPWLGGVLAGNQQLMQQMYQLWEAGTSWEDMPEALELAPEKPSAPLLRLRGRLQEQVERYLVWLALEKDADQQHLFLLRELIDRNAAYHFPILQRKLARNRESQPVRDATYNRVGYEEALLRQVFSVKHPPNFRKGQDYTADRINQWLAGMGKELLTLGLVAHSGRQPERDTLDILIDAYRLSGPVLDEPAQLLMDLYQRYRTEDWKQDTLPADRTLLAHMRTLKPQFQARDFADLHVLFTNYVIQNIRHLPTPGYFDLLVQLYTWSLETKLWDMNRASYRNITNLYGNLILLSELPAQKQAYAQQGLTFLQDYKAHLEPAEQEAAYAYNAANLQFALGNYDRIRVVRLTEQFNDPHYDIGYELNLLKADMEMGTDLYFTAHFDRLRRRISRTESLSPTSRQGYLHHLSILRKIPGLQFPSEAEALLEEIAQTRLLEGRIWLTQKVKEMVKRLPSH